MSFVVVHILYAFSIVETSTADTVCKCNNFHKSEWKYKTGELEYRYKTNLPSQQPDET